uniref:C2H2-type domain-containing protein n=1 Tax=Anabas testudineus TaxID=64144 RepID=A0AAQ6IJK5_ANATE
MPLSSQLQPVRRKKGQRMKKILLKEKRGLREEAHTSSTKAASPDWAPPEVSDSEDSANFSKDTSYMAPVSDCSENDSWSYYSEDDSDHMNTSNSNCSMADSRSTEDNILPPKKIRKVQFKLFSSLKTHMLRRCYEYIQQQVSPETPDKAKNIYKCDECQAAFRYKVSLERHKVTHNELYCNVCRRSFTYFLPLQRHFENVHKISRPFKCNHCPKTLPKLRALIVHEWTHTGHLPFQCAQCSVRFRSDSELIHHQRVHTREKPYLCPECGKTFSQRSNLLRHVKLVHKKPFVCHICGKAFPKLYSMQRHKNLVHTFISH